MKPQSSSRISDLRALAAGVSFAIQKNNAAVALHELEKGLHELHFWETTTLMLCQESGFAPSFIHNLSLSGITSFPFKIGTQSTCYSLGRCMGGWQSFAVTETHNNQAALCTTAQLTSTFTSSKLILHYCHNFCHRALFKVVH